MPKYECTRFRFVYALQFEVYVTNTHVFVYQYTSRLLPTNTYLLNGCSPKVLPATTIPKLERLHLGTHNNNKKGGSKE